MKGKKADAGFVADYVLKCAKKKISSPEQIIEEAEMEISKIDDILKSVIELKKKRSKLVDVVAVFQNKTKAATSDKSSLGFYIIKDLKFAASVIDSLPILDSVEFFTEIVSKETMYCIKQLVNLRVLSCANHKLHKAERFDDFMKFLKEMQIV